MPLKAIGDAPVPGMRTNSWTGSVRLGGAGRTNFRHVSFNFETEGEPAPFWATVFAFFKLDVRSKRGYRSTSLISLLTLEGITYVPPRIATSCTAPAYFARNATSPLESVPLIVQPFSESPRSARGFVSRMTLPALPASAAPARASRPFGSGAPLATHGFAALSRPFSTR